VVLPQQLAGTGRLSTTEFKKPQNRWKILIGESIMIRKERVVFHYKALSQNSPRQIEENHAKFRSGLTGAPAIFEPNKSHTKLQGLQEHKYRVAQKNLYTLYSSISLE